MARSSRHFLAQTLAYYCGSFLRILFDPKQIIIKRYLAHVAVACILVTSMHISHSYSSSRLLRLVVKNSSSIVAVAVCYELRAQYLHPPPYRGGVMGWLKPHLKCSA